MSLEEGHL